jgi:hypothetical protein
MTDLSLTEQYATLDEAKAAAKPTIPRASSQRWG